MGETLRRFGLRDYRKVLRDGARLTRAAGRPGLPSRPGCRGRAGAGPARSLDEPGVSAGASETDGRPARCAVAFALITDVAVPRTGGGSSLADLMVAGGQVITVDQCMSGIPELIHSMQVKPTFPEGTKLVTVRHPPLVERPAPRRTPCCP